MHFQQLPQTFYLMKLFDPPLNAIELLVVYDCLQIQFKFATVHLTLNHCLGVRQDWYPMCYLKMRKARVSSVQSVKPRGILAPTRDLNQEFLGSQSIVLNNHFSTFAHVK